MEVTASQTERTGTRYLGECCIQAENVVVPDSDAKDLISIQDAAKSEVMQETQGISH